MDAPARPTGSKISPRSDLTATSTTADAASLAARGLDTTGIGAAGLDAAELLAWMAHELKSPLQLVGQGWTTLESHLREPELISVARAMSRQYQALSRLLEESEGILCGSADGLPAAREELNLGVLLQELEQAWRLRFEEKSVLLRYIPSGKHCWVPLDPVRVAMIVQNLLSNALHHSDAGCRVTLRGYPQGEEVIIEVSDTGRGIPKAELEHVFAPYFRGREACDAGEGLGLGLAIVACLAEAQGGNATAYSAGEGRGASFRVSLPVVSPEV